MKDVIIYDIETMQELFLIVCMIPGKVGKSFQVSKWKNELDKFVRYTEAHPDAYWVGYNNLRFDSQVVEWILRNYDNWHELSNLEITAKIHQKASDVIHDANYDVFPEFREYELSLKQIDLFKIHHFDNKNRRVSLKRLEFEMDLENIEEMPIHHDTVGITKDDIILTTEDCINDVWATYQFYKVTIGETDHPLYKGENRIQLRQDIQEEFGIPCLNYSDSKIGDEMIKKYCCEQKGIDSQPGECFNAQQVISTIPINELQKMLVSADAELAVDHDRKLEFRSMIFMFLEINRPAVTDNHWIYFPDRECIFQRTSEFNNFSPAMCPEGKTGVCIEIPCDYKDNLWNMSNEALYEKVIQQAEEESYLKRQWVDNYHVVKERYTYPTYDLSYAKILAKIRDYVDRFHGLYSIGRQGAFKYINMADEVMMMGFEAAQKIGGSS